MGFEKMSQMQEIIGEVRESMKNDHIETRQVETRTVRINTNQWTSQRED